MKHFYHHPGNIEDAALLGRAAAILRRASLDLDDLRKGASTIYGDDGFDEAAIHIERAVSELEAEAAKATKNAVDDAEGDEADRLHAQRKDDEACGFS